MKLRRARTITSLLNEKPRPLNAWFTPQPRPEPPDPRRCHACCKTPGFGCAKNFHCPCHITTKETTL